MPALVHVSPLVEQSPPMPEQIAGDPRLEAVIGAILSRSMRWTGADVYSAQAQLVDATAHTRLELAKVCIWHWKEKFMLLMLASILQTCAAHCIAWNRHGAQC